MELKLTDREIDIIKTCAAMIAKNYDQYEPWITPNTILLRYGLKPWERVDESQYWYDSETAVSYPFG